MKKLGVLAIFLFIVFGAAFLWLLGKSAPENAKSETITIEVEDNFEK